MHADAEQDRIFRGALSRVRERVGRVLDVLRACAIAAWLLVTVLIGWHWSRVSLAGYLALAIGLVFVHRSFPRLRPYSIAIVDIPATCLLYWAVVASEAHEDMALVCLSTTFSLVTLSFLTLSRRAVVVSGVVGYVGIVAVQFNTATRADLALRDVAKKASSAS